jgi:hypothetical protein
MPLLAQRAPVESAKARERPITMTACVTLVVVALLLGLLGQRLLVGKCSLYVVPYLDFVFGRRFAVVVTPFRGQLATRQDFREWQVGPVRCTCRE